MMLGNRELDEEGADHRGEDDTAQTSGKTPLSRPVEDHPSSMVAITVTA